MKKEKKPKKNLAKKIDEALSPKKKEEGPTSTKPKTVKDENIDNLKNIGKRFGENL